MKKKVVFALMAGMMTAAFAFGAAAEETEAVTEAVTEAAAEEAVEETEEETEFRYTDLPEMDVDALVELGEYKGLTVEEEKVGAYPDEEVIASFASSLTQTVTEGTVELGDTAIIDYEGKLDGVAFDGGTAEGASLTIGSGQFIDGFEDGLIGVAIGDTVDLNLTFPDPYQSEELAGQDVVFTVTVQSVKRVPEFTDELSQEKFGMSAADYIEQKRQELISNKKAEVRGNSEFQLLVAAAENSTVKEYPEEALGYFRQTVIDYYETMAYVYGLELEDFIAYFGMAQEDFDAMVEEAAKESLAQTLTVMAIGKAEGFEVSDEEYEKEVKEAAENAAYEDTAVFEENYGKNYIHYVILQEKVLEFLYDEGNIVIGGAEETAEETEAAETEAVETETAE